MENTIYNQELIDINISKENRNIFVGEVSGSLEIFCDKKIPESFHPIHLNRSLLGIHTPHIKPTNERLGFTFTCTSFYKLLCEIEYIRTYSKFKELKIKKLNIIIDFPKDIFIESSLDYEKYNNQIHQELADINRSHKLPRFFSGTVNAKCDILYYNNDDEILNEEKFTSIYHLVAKLEDIRNSSALIKKQIQNITIELVKTDDSKINVDYELMQFYEEEDLDNS